MHRPSNPAFGSLAASFGNQAGLDLRIKRALLARARSLVESLQAALNKALPCALNRCSPNAQCGGDLLVRAIVGSLEQNPRATLRVECFPERSNCCSSSRSSSDKVTRYFFFGIAGHPPTRIFNQLSDSSKSAHQFHGGVLLATHDPP